MLYSTYLGGTTGYSTMTAVAADAQGNAYVTGQTFASDYPHTSGLPNGSASGGVGAVSAVFFAKISPAGDKIAYAGGLTATTRICTGGSSCFLSPLATYGVSIAVDPAGNAYIAGNTGGRGLPTTPGAFLPDGVGAFAAKVNSSGTGMVYVTLMDGATYGSGTFVGATTSVFAIAVDAAGDAYLAGSTSDPSFPTTAGAFQTKLADSKTTTPPPPDGFVAKLNPTGNAIVWATYLGGSAADQAQTIALDSAGNVWVSGTTQSTDFPVSAGFPGGTDFLAEFNHSGSVLLNARYPSGSVATALAVDSSGLVHASGANGLVSLFTPIQLAAPRIYGIANAAGGH